MQGTDALISIRKSLSELEKAQHLRTVACEGYANAINSAADYAVELDAAQADSLRRNLRLIREQLQSAAEPEDFQAVQANFRGELRLYRDRSAEWLERLQRDLQSATLVMESLAGNVTANGVDHEKKLDADLMALATVERSTDLGGIKKVVREAAASISESWEQLRRANQLAVAQLHDEIRALHREIDNERRALYTDAATGAWNRQKLTARMEDNLGRRDAFCLILATISNLQHLRATHSQTVTDGALKALVRRIFGMVGKDTMVGRWSENQIAMLLEIDPTQALPIAAAISRELSTRYSIQENGVAKSITLRIDASTVEAPAGVAAAKFREKLALAEAPKG